ncbi:cystathionine beta-lyase [Enterovibrio norvegicus FF-33]|uniref:cysteine-S-conjugate beta-lyase n=1 Tax=Enterovibrio norvegicus FF-454 TaxID=1185651 RepID=A0A1E5BZ91_9GAMM|nr:cystathionine beta-lyase [Enterovibrio norvegicus]OEE58530.1 cystathionine beta-lyase [Enterovibrio norvegicus FF-454]OEE67416.1 cystathionine beta-lyase [Enterovibrio norvegicus FF-33]OEE80076.1 cystathionine beta-lyase [Enterovibrio norvegicus FF-162]
MSSEKLNTKLVSAGRKKEYCHGSVNSVIQRASSIVFDSVEQKKLATKQRGERGLFYGRRGTLTHFAFQDAMTELEGGAGCVLYPCGAAAIANSMLSFVKSGDHVLMTGGAYEPTQGFCNTILADMGISTTYYDPMRGADVATLMTPNTSVVFLEVPNSITMEVPNIPAIVNAVRAVNADVVIMIDNTWAAGVLFNAFEHDIDISIQAGTKYIVGHSDAMIGTAVANSRCWERLRERSYLMGQMVDADTAYMASRGLRTLGIRLKQHHESSTAVAAWLSERPEVARVNHPALPEAIGHENYLRDFSGSCGLFSFVLNKKLTDEQIAEYLDNFTHFSMAYSWGGYESLILANQPEELNAIRPAGPVDFEGTLVRVHIGLEDIDDLIADLQAGFERIA